MVALAIALAGIGLALFICAVSVIGHANCDTVCHTSLLAVSPLAALGAGAFAIGVLISLCLRADSAVALTSVGVICCWIVWFGSSGLGH